MATSCLRIDRTFFEQIRNSHTGKTLSYCYQCGTCSSSCPMADEMDIRPHEIVELAKMGLKDTILQSRAIWQCSTCYMCTERCPQGVQLTNIILTLRDTAMRGGVSIPEAVKESCKNLYETGRLLTPSQFQKERRVELELPVISQIDASSIRDLATKTRIADILQVK